MRLKIWIRSYSSYHNFFYCSVLNIQFIFHFVGKVTRKSPAIVLWHLNLWCLCVVSETPHGTRLLSISHCTFCATYLLCIHKCYMWMYKIQFVVPFISIILTKYSCVLTGTMGATATWENPQETWLSTHPVSGSIK